MIATDIHVDLILISGSKRFLKVFWIILRDWMQLWSSLDYSYSSLPKFIRSFRRLPMIFWDVWPECIIIKQLEFSMWSSCNDTNDHLASWVKHFWTHFVRTQNMIVSWLQQKIFVVSISRNILSLLTSKLRSQHHHVSFSIFLHVAWMHQVSTHYR